jgi:ABC-type amino acid transport substrate-binding protein
MIQNILTGQADVAFTDPAALYLALDKGADLVAIYKVLAGAARQAVDPDPLALEVGGRADALALRRHDVEHDYVPGTGGGSAIQNILTGQADVAFTDPAALYLARRRSPCRAPAPGPERAARAARAAAAGGGGRSPAWSAPSTTCRAPAVARPFKTS